MKNTINHDKSKHKTIHHLRFSGSSIDGAASKVVRYQKYAVSDDFEHSSTTLPLSVGHVDQGNGY